MNLYIDSCQPTDGVKSIGMDAHRSKYRQRRCPMRSEALQNYDMREIERKICKRNQEGAFIKVRGKTWTLRRPGSQVENMFQEKEGISQDQL